MFTGIVSAVGRIDTVRELGASALHGKRLEIVCPAGFLDDLAPGDSVALNGACMTATDIDRLAGRLRVDISLASLQRSTGLGLCGSVNLEKALRANDRLGGHMVSGHVDGVGSVSHFAQVGESWELRILCPAELSRYLALKGSLTINGVSLTLNRVSDLASGCEVSINLIPHTLQHTTLGLLAPGARVNLEIDLIARYVERMLGAGVAVPADAGWNGRANPAQPKATA